MSADETTSLVLRLAGPLQSWGVRSQYNRRETQSEPTKSGLVGLLAAAQGRRRTDPIQDLVGLSIGVRTDQPGTLLRDYHTVSDYRGRPLLSASVNAKGAQKPTSPAKYTGVTTRYYLQDAVFVVAVHGPREVLTTLVGAMTAPAFPLALGRRSCPPTQPVLLPVPAETVGVAYWPGDALATLATVPWQAGPAHRRETTRRHPHRLTVPLPVTVDDPQGEVLYQDLPVSFEPKNRRYASRRVHQDWVFVANPEATVDGAATADDHDVFALLGW